MAVKLRLGARLSEPHQYPCDIEVEPLCTISQHSPAAEKELVAQLGTTQQCSTAHVASCEHFAASTCQQSRNQCCSACWSRTIRWYAPGWAGSYSMADCIGTSQPLIPWPSHTSSSTGVAAEGVEHRKELRYTSLLWPPLVFETLDPIIQRARPMFTISLVDV